MLRNYKISLANLIDRLRFIGRGVLKVVNAHVKPPTINFLIKIMRDRLPFSSFRCEFSVLDELRIISGIQFICRRPLLMN